MNKEQRRVVALVSERYGVSTEDVINHMGPLVGWLESNPETSRNLVKERGLARETLWLEVLRHFDRTGRLTTAEEEGAGQWR